MKLKEFTDLNERKIMMSVKLRVQKDNKISGDPEKFIPAEKL